MLRDDSDQTFQSSHSTPTLPSSISDINNATNNLKSDIYNVQSSLTHFLSSGLASPPHSPNYAHAPSQDYLSHQPHSIHSMQNLTLTFSNTMQYAQSPPMYHHGDRGSPERSRHIIPYSHSPEQPRLHPASRSTTNLSLDFSSFQSHSPSRFQPHDTWPEPDPMIASVTSQTLSQAHKLSSMHIQLVESQQQVETLLKWHQMLDDILDEKERDMERQLAEVRERERMVSGMVRNMEGVLIKTRESAWEPVHSESIESKSRAFAALSRVHQRSISSMSQGDLTHSRRGSLDARRLSRDADPMSPTTSSMAAMAQAVRNLADAVNEEPEEVETTLETNWSDPNLRQSISQPTPPYLHSDSYDPRPSISPRPSMSHPTSPHSIPSSPHSMPSKAILELSSSIVSTPPLIPSTHVISPPVSSSSTKSISQVRPAASPKKSSSKHLPLKLSAPRAPTTAVSGTSEPLPGSQRRLSSAKSESQEQLTSPKQSLTALNDSSLSPYRPTPKPSVDIGKQVLVNAVRPTRVSAANGTTSAADMMATLARKEMSNPNGKSAAPTASASAADLIAALASHEQEPQEPQEPQSAPSQTPQEKQTRRTPRALSFDINSVASGEFSYRGHGATATSPTNAPLEEDAKPTGWLKRWL